MLRSFISVLLPCCLMSRPSSSEVSGEILARLFCLHAFTLAPRAWTGARNILLPQPCMAAAHYACVCDKQSHRSAPDVCSFPSDGSGCCTMASWWMSSLSSCSSSGGDLSETARQRDGSRFGKLFLVSNLSDGWAEGTFLLLQVSVAATGLTEANYGHCCRLSLEYGNIGNIVCIIYFFIYLLKILSLLQAFISYSLMLY